MLTRLLLTFAALALLIGAWVAIQAAARRIAARHPEAGPYREAGGSCGCCGSCASDCATDEHPKQRQGH